MLTQESVSQSQPPVYAPIIPPPPPPRPPLSDPQMHCWARIITLIHVCGLTCLPPTLIPRERRGRLEAGPSMYI